MLCNSSFSLFFYNTIQKCYLILYFISGCYYYSVPALSVAALVHLLVYRTIGNSVLMTISERLPTVSTVTQISNEAHISE
jgi:hypothetical protein